MPKVIDPTLRLQALVKRVGSQQAAARELGVSNAFVSDLLKGRRHFSENILGKLGLRRAAVAADSDNAA